MMSFHVACVCAVDTISLEGFMYGRHSKFGFGMKRLANGEVKKRGR